MSKLESIKIDDAEYVRKDAVNQKADSLDGMSRVIGLILVLASTIAWLATCICAYGWYAVLVGLGVSVLLITMFAVGVYLLIR